MSQYIERASLQVSSAIDTLVMEDILPGTGLDAGKFWQGFADLITEFTPVNRALLQKREELQAKVDQWHKEHRGELFNFSGL